MEHTISGEARTSSRKTVSMPGFAERPVPSRDTLGTIERAGHVLELFTTDVPEWGPTAVANALEIPKSRAHATLASLAQIGLLQRGVGGTYRLGWLTLSLGASATRSSRLWTLSAPVMHALAETVGETVNLAVLDRSHVVYVGKKQGRLTLPRTENSLGARTPVHSTACGKMLLAEQSEDVVEWILERDGLPRFTDQTIDDRGELQKELEQVRQLGTAFDRGELQADLRCAAVPVRDASGRVAGVMTISAEAERWSRYHREYESALRGSAKEVTTRWRRI